MSKYRGILAGGGELKVTGKNFHLFTPIKVTFNQVGGFKVIPGGINNTRLFALIMFQSVAEFY